MNIIANINVLRNTGLAGVVEGRKFAGTAAILVTGNVSETDSASDDEDDDEDDNSGSGR